MEIKNKDILVLGGWGLVGNAVCRQLLVKHPKSITIASLRQSEAEEAVAGLTSQAGDTQLKAVGGNIFVRSTLKDLTRDQILQNREYRLQVAEDVLERTTATSFEKFTLYQMITQIQPQLIIDSVNTATGVAYQDIYSAGLKVLTEVRNVKEGMATPDLLVEVEKLLDTLYLPQLVRHVQILYQAMRAAGTQTYVKIGTSGTGGMGLNIPYTHSEDKPSRVLLSKSCIAGAHSLLLFLMGRTPDAPYTKEVKPATAIAWKAIKYSEVLRGGKPIPLFDCPIENADVLSTELNTQKVSVAQPLNENLKGVFIDTGENGTFSLGEFTAITTYEQMEYITPEEIAQTVIWEIEGGPTGHDIVSALDASVLGPTYRAGVMRSLALEKMKALASEHQDASVAFELLGPPRLSKLLYEAHLLKRTAGSIDQILANKPEALASSIENLLKEDSKLRAKIISIGIPILLADGRRLLRGPAIKVPQDPRSTLFTITDEKLNQWAANGWVDLRPQNIKVWQNRLRLLLQQAGSIDNGDTSSAVYRDLTFWRSDQPLDEGELVGWIFINEDKGRRIK
ncbi:MAG: short-chain dehydrogenase [Calditrichota bacterium]